MEILVKENFLDEDLFVDTAKRAKEILKEGKHNFWTHHMWDKGIVKDSFPVLVHLMSREEPIYNRLKASIERFSKLETGDIMFYYWTRFSYIPWHDDHLVSGGITVYLNDIWDEDCGGYFMYKSYDDNKNEIKAIVPKRNLAVLQKGGVLHATTPVNYEGNIKYTLQAFLNSRP